MKIAQEEYLMNDKNRKHRGRNIPWKRVISFHKEIAARAEGSFFSLITSRVIRLAIEVDGGQYHEGIALTDRSRDSFLQAQGCKVFRTPARAVLETPHNVIIKIKEELELCNDET